MGDHLKECVEIHQLADIVGDSIPSESAEIQTLNNIRIELKLNPQSELNVDTNPYLVSSSKIAAAVPSIDDSRAQHQPLRRSRKRKANEVESNTCELCGKNFPSLKSKYGHMKSHPERISRRMRRQFTKLSKCPVTARRCQNSALYDEIHIAANILMQISRDQSHLKGEQVSNIVPSRNEAEDTKIEMCSKEAEDFGTNHKDGSSRMYNCAICKMVFNTHQALGGHTVSHNNRKNSGEKGKIVMEGNGADPTGAENSVNLCYMMNKKASTDHRCNTCGLTFPSGQALGGHKRMHWTGQNGHLKSTPSNSSIQSSVERAEIATPAVVSFDLNVKPLDEG